MHCTSCQHENDVGAKFCEACGAPLRRVCPSCGQPAKPTARFCPECGTALEVEPRPSPKGRARQSPPKARKASRRAISTTTRPSRPRSLEAERRQLTVMFCDLVGSTTLSAQLDPEEYREVVQQYQDTCTSVIRGYEGHIAQHLGDGLLVYFGYPTAHEDDAARAVRTGLKIIQALKGQETESEGQRKREPLQVRIGIHTGLVVIGEIGSSEKREMLALGETPNLAARVQGVAEPDAVVMSAATYRLVHGLFECQNLGPQTLKGISTPLSLYRIIAESAAQSRFEVAIRTGLTPLIGREPELEVLRQHWEHAKAGAGQVVLVNGEPGIGKSRLVQELKEQLGDAGVTRLEFRCSPYHQNSAFYPIVEHLQRFLQFQREESPTTKLNKLAESLSRYRFPQADTHSLLAALLSLPPPEGSPPLTLSPQKQKQKTQEALVAWLVEEAEKATVYCAWEDLHWADPSTLEVLTLFLGQIPTARVFSVLTFRPEFTPPWSLRSYLTSLTLGRLGRQQVEAMVTKITGGKTLPSEVLQQVVSKTDGVPLFVEELTKVVVESSLLREGEGHYELTGPLRSLAIPGSLQDALMARLDQLAPVRELAQWGATLGREFSYELIHSVSQLNEAALQHGLRQLVDAELIYQRGLPPQATYVFKHALIQDTAYESLLKSKRRQLHQQIARVLEEQFAETKETQPELLAHHYTEAGLSAQAIPYWQRAGERAIHRSAHMEAISHLTKGLELLKTLLDTPERAQQELALQLALSDALPAVKGYAAPEVEKTVLRARELCQQIGETPQLFPVLFRLWAFYINRGELQTIRELAEQLMRLAQSVQDRYLLSVAHMGLGATLVWGGEFASARVHLEQGIANFDSQRHRSLLFSGGYSPGVSCLCYTAWALWHLGYPDQALKRSHEALVLAQELSHPFPLAFALFFVTELHFCRREGQASQERAEELIAFSTEQEFPYWLAAGIGGRSWALAEQGRIEEGIAEILQGGARFRATGAGVGRSKGLGQLAEMYRKVGRIEEGLSLLARALDVVVKHEERMYEAELYRLKGTLTLQSRTSLGQVEGKSEVSSSQTEAEAEACFLKAIEIARRQQAKSLELRAVTSLSRLWQQRGKKDEARQMLAEIYSWFTEGFDTKDLQEAKALLEELT